MRYKEVSVLRYEIGAGAIRKENRMKIANFPTTSVFNAPAEGVPLGIWYWRKGSQKLK